MGESQNFEQQSFRMADISNLRIDERPNVETYESYYKRR